MKVRVKMYGIDTVNSTLGMEWGVGIELTGSELNLGYTKFALSSGEQHRIREADHSPPSKTKEKNVWNHNSSHFHTGV